MLKDPFVIKLMIFYFIVTVALAILASFIVIAALAILANVC